MIKIIIGLIALAIIIVGRIVLHRRGENDKFLFGILLPTTILFFACDLYFEPSIPSLLIIVGFSISLGVNYFEEN